ncbi:integrase, catalytic region, zinc finger, CCHC-type containing protein [Tanacetum coccineum]
MDICGPMHVASINGKKNILVIVDDYSRFTWVKFLASKDEDPNFIIKFLKMIQVRLNTPVRNIHTDNGTGKPDLSYLYVFGALCYPNKDSEDLGKLQAKADIGIFIGNAPNKKAYRIYNRHTQKIIETIHVDFDELTTMAFEQLGSGPRLQSMTHATSSSGLVPNPIPQKPCTPPPRDDWDHLFQLMFDEYFNPPTIVVSPVSVAAAPRTVDLSDSPVSTSIDQDDPSISITSTQNQEHSPIISQGSSSNVRPIHTPFKSLGRWTKDHPIANVIGDSSHFVFTRKQLQTDAMWCYFDAFLTSVEQKNFKQAMTEPSWIDATQEEIHEFERKEEGINFEESFTSVARIESIRIFVANATNKNTTIFQMDVKMAFLMASSKKSFLLSQHFSKGAVDPMLFTWKAGHDLLLV